MSSGLPSAEPSRAPFAVLALAPAVLLLTAALTIGLGFRPVGDFGVETDFYGIYAPRAEAILHGDVRPADYGVTGPLYEVALAAGGTLGASFFRWAQLLSALAAAGSLVVWWRIAARFVPSGAAWTAPWLLLLSPALARHAYLAAGDAFYLLLFSIAVLLVLKADTPGRAALAGAAALAAVLTRYAGLLLLAWAPFALPKGPRRAARLGAFAAVAVGVPAVLLGLVVAGGGTLPAPEFLRNVGYAAADSTDWDAYVEATRVRSTGGILHGLGIADAGRLLARIPAHAARFAGATAGPALALLGLAGLVAFVATRRRSGARPSGPFLLLGGLVAAALAPFQPSERYALPLAPWFAVFGAFGLAAIPRPVRRGRGAALAAAAFVVVLAGLAFNGNAQVAYQANLPAYLPGFARGVLAAGARPKVVLARKPHLPYLLGARWAYFPDAADLESLRTRMRAAGVDHVLYATSEFALRPRFRFLAFPEYRPRGWTVDYEEPDRGVFYGVDTEFYVVPVAPDDADVRGLMNAVISDADAVPAARRLAAYLAATGRCPQALAEFGRLRRVTALTPDEEALYRSCLPGGDGAEDER